MKTIICGSNSNGEHNCDYEKLLYALQRHSERKFEKFGKYLFRTDATGLFDLFLSELGEDVRQYYTCNTCRQFVNQYGNLVFIGKDGVTIPLLWEDTSEYGIFDFAVNVCSKAVREAKVTGVFFSGREIWGTPVTGEWHHMFIKPPQDILCHSLIKKPHELEAEKQEDFKNILTALTEYDAETITSAVQILKTEALNRSEKFMGMANWFADLKYIFTSNHRNIRTNLLWSAVAQSPAGFCHIRSSMIGTLLDDLKSGMPFDAVKKRFDEKMHPLQYQRPSSSPSDGNIRQAEELVRKMGIEKSLERRFARIEEVPLIWKPVNETQKKNGIFGHLSTGRDRRGDIEIPRQKITWVRFRRDVLPSVISAEICVPEASLAFSAIITAADINAPPIIRWDLPEKRNPLSWYFRVHGDIYKNWNLDSPGYKSVAGITVSPDGGDGAFFIIAGCKDIRYKKSGIALFPEILRSEFHSVRKTIEAYSRNANLLGYEEASACGLFFKKELTTWTAYIRVRCGNICSEYHIDRWE